MPETILRIGSFLGILIIMGTAETLWPRRKLGKKKIRRWTANLSVSFISTIAVRVLLPLAPSAFALFWQEKGFGLFNLVSMPYWLDILLAVLALDMIIYWQHVAFHRIPILWKVHRMHHADTDIDASTGIRFHPIEIIISMGIKFIAIALLGPPAIGVIVFEVTLNGCALFNHSNVNLPLGLDKWLRLIVVTPDQHRVHHSTDMREANMNYGFNFPWWDRIFKSYKAQPDKGHEKMVIGMNIFRDDKYKSIREMLAIPFR